MQITSHGSSAKMVEWTVWPSEAMQTLHLFIWLTWSACLMWSACQTVMWPPLSVFNVSICLKNPLTLIALSQIPCTRVSSFNLLKWHYKISTLYMCTFFFFFFSSLQHRAQTSPCAKQTICAGTSLYNHCNSDIIIVCSSWGVWLWPHC